MHRIFLDANVLFSAAYRPDSGLLKLWEMKVELIASAYALEEAAINLERGAQRDRLSRLTRNVEIISTHTDLELPEGVTLPEKDRPIMAAAIAAKSSHLLTGDITHFGPYLGRTISGVFILTPAEYIRSRIK